MKTKLLILFLLMSAAIFAQEVVEEERNDSLVLGNASIAPMMQADNVREEVVYDPITGNYVLHTKVGEMDIVTPTLMSANEYKAYSEKLAMGKYWEQKQAEQEHDNEKKFDITDMKFNIGPADKIFGPGGVQLKLQGSAELLFGFKHQFIDNPALTVRSRNNNIFDFDEKIQASINGKVGDKLNFNLNYNTEASFDFDQQNLKLNYKGEEDDIIQSIEGGNVTMNLNSSLIRGSQALFGVKTNLKFGKLSIQALLSQQNSESQSVSSEGGAQTTKYEINIDQYDENRHFFLSHWFRDNYEKNMEQLPYIASGVTINRIEVWVTNKRGRYDQARNIVAFADLGENDPDHIQNNHWTSNGSQPNPYNKANTLYQEIISMGGIRDIQQTNAVLQTLNAYGIYGGEDYEKLESARLLTSTEYTLNSALGYISLRSALNQDEVLCVAYEYTYAGQVYQVGEFSTDGSESLKAPNTLVLKMLKSSGNAPNKKGKGTWDLMMKNIYSIGASQMTSEAFELYITYRNDSVGTDLQYLPEGAIKGKQLLRVMNLDRLDSKNNPYADGKFDYIENYTALSSGGKIIFPVLEPFGSHLRKVIGNDAIAEKYVFQELYDSTLIVAQEMSEKNKYTITGRYKGSAGNEIRLNAMNIPRGSVKVTAGGATLIENVDYTVDYTMGTVTILNQSVIESGTKVDVQLENNSTFSMKRKSLMGTHLEYQFNKDFTIGGTLMYMNERPLTTKVNSGDEPISNTIWGVNLNYKTEFMWLTNLLDKLPFTTATAPSTFQINAEFAHLIPGHTKEVGKAGLAYIDDFEATKTNIDIHYPNYWKLASTPSEFSEASLSNDIQYGKNRAHFAWYVVDPIFGKGQSNTPQYIKEDVEVLSDHRTRIIHEEEIYPNKQVLANQETRMSVLNLAYYPSERGMYNICADEIGIDGKLTNPTSRWGGIMRRLDNTDFETANIEYIEFWMMDPFLTNPDASYDGGDLYFNLGDISEDILRDGKKSFEHGLPVGTETDNTDKTVWGRVPKTTSTTVAFSSDAGARTMQDVGLNGLSTEQEFAFEYNGTHPYKDYVDALRNKVDASVLSQWQNDEFSPLNDPSGDNYHYYRGTDYDERRVTVLDRYKHYNGLEGNSPATENGTETYGTAATLTPDIEDINSDNTLNEYEKYYIYKVQLRPGMMEVGKQHITEKKVVSTALENGTTVDVTWYQFKIPIREYDDRYGSIRNFKSIRFIRMYLTGFKDETFLRFASLDLVRGDWRAYSKDLYPINEPPSTTAQLDVQAVNIEENSNRTPVNYILPPGVSRQTDPGQAQLIAQNEQAMVMRVHDLSPKDAKAVYKNVFYDMRQYKKIQMFIHAEMLEEDPELKDGDLSCFIRIGSDMKNNYYEYEIPLYLTDPGIYNNDSEQDRAKVWPEDNMFDFPFKVLTDAKLARDKAKRSGTSGVGNTIPYVMYDDASGKPKNRITVLGNPSVGEIENIMIGIRNNGTKPCSGEIWVNELRMSEFNEEGGVAAMANVALGLSDIGQLNVAGRLETAGYGSIESNVLDRNMDNNYQLSVSAAFEAGRLFPEKARIQLPLYVTYTNQTSIPEYDPLNTDVKLSETLEIYETKEEKDSIKSMSNTSQTSTSVSLTNAKVDIHSKKQNMFYDPANFAISYSWSERNEQTPEMERNYQTEQKGSFTYSFNFNAKPWEPFKDSKKVSKLKWIKELNLYYMPQSWSFSTDMRRNFTNMKMRDFNTDPTATQNMDITFSKDFVWNRNFDFKYDLTKNIKFTFQTAMNSTVDEGFYTPEIIEAYDYEFLHDEYAAWKDTICRSLAKWGTPYTYQQVFTGSVNVPFNRFKALDWITANGTYNATYNWNRTAQSANMETDLGNVVSSQQSWQADGALNFESLYNKSKYWKNLKQRLTGRNSRRVFKPKTYTQAITLAKDSTINIKHNLGSNALDIVATDSAGNKIKMKCRNVDNNTIAFTAKQDCEAINLTVTTKNPNDRNALQTIGDFSAYFGTMIRKLQVTYRATDALTVPGFAPQAGFMGQRKVEDMYAPGFDFAFGFIPDDWLQKAKNKQWLSGDTTVVQPATRAKTSDFDVKLNLEPFPGFKISVSGKRYAAESSSIIYSYDHLQETMTGSFNITQLALMTAFDKVGTEDQNFTTKSYERFLEYRDIMQTRVQEQYTGITYPTTGFMQGQFLGGKTYDPKYGTVNKNSADVIVPAFLAAYTGKKVNKISTNPFLGILNILPNWSVTFDGLGKLPWIRDHFKSINLTHAYSCKYSIGSYGSYSTWVPAAEDGNKMIGFVRDVETDNPIPSAAYDIANVTISEQFAPLIGVNIAMKNSMTTKIEYRKQRNLSMNVTSVQMTEGLTDEFVLGFAYTVKDFDVILKLKNDTQNKVKNDLKLSVDVSYKDIKTLLRKVEENITQASSGNKVFGIKVAADYVLSSKINLQLFYDHQGTTPLISTSYPVKADNVGLNIKLMLTR